MSRVTIGGSAHAWRLPFTRGRLIAWARRTVRQHPVLAAAAAVVLAGGAAGAAVAWNSSDATRPAGACPVTGGYYAYAVPQDPAHPPAAASGPTSWGWTPRAHQIRVGDRMRLNGRLWQVTEIAAMPGVEPIGKPFAIIGWQPPTATTTLTMCGRLVFRPVG